MASKIVFDDGREVTLSIETTERLKKELLKPEPKFLDVRKVRMCTRTDSCYPIGIGIESNYFNPEPANGMTEDYTFSILTKENAQEVVNSLQTIIDNLN